MAKRHYLLSRILVISMNDGGPRCRRLCHPYRQNAGCGKRNHILSEVKLAAFLSSRANQAGASAAPRMQLEFVSEQIPSRTNLSFSDVFVAPVMHLNFYPTVKNAWTDSVVWSAGIEWFPVLFGLASKYIIFKN